MKNTMKIQKFIKSVFALLIVSWLIAQPFIVNAFTISGTITNGTTPAGNSGNVIFTNGIAIYKITLTGTNTTAQNAFIQFFDSPSAKVTNNNPAYFVSTLTITNVSTNYVNLAGVTETFTNQELIIVTNAYAASNFTYRPLLNLIAQTNNSVTYTPVTPLITTLGLMATGSIGCSFTVDYISFK